MNEMKVFNNAEGSPPQVRGKPKKHDATQVANGITPAGAGKTTGAFAPEYKHTGSPPQVRGKPVSFIVCGLLIGITPAGAGKTKGKWRKQPPRKDHPRRCGENAASTAFMLAASGSPPQVRGKLYNCRCAMGTRRITPAGAGKT